MPLKIEFILIDGTRHDFIESEQEIVFKLFGDDFGKPLSAVKISQMTDNGEQTITLDPNND